MKQYFLLPIAAAFMVSPALAQSSNTNSGNLETRDDVIRGAEESERPGVFDFDRRDRRELRTGRSAAEDSGSNSDNLVTGEEVRRGAERSSRHRSNFFDNAADDFGNLFD
jgi:hypothetical protein